MKFLRYPGSKAKQITFLSKYLPEKEHIEGNYIEPFVGGGSVFLHVKPTTAMLSDLNNELIEVYKGIKRYPNKVWDTYRKFPRGKAAYYSIRDNDYSTKPLSYRAARTLYLNRTCFKGMWRHNKKKAFNVSYGGVDRGLVITHQNIIELSEIFQAASFEQKDFGRMLKRARSNDFIFLDPPYKPGQKEMKGTHYINGHFTFDDQIRLAKQLKKISSNYDIKWLMTNSSHPDICKLYEGFNIIALPQGKSEQVGVLTNNSSEVVISNY